MKKLAMILLAAALLLATLAGCGPGGGLDGRSGEEIAKLLLAGERLNASELAIDGDLFGDGANAMRRLASGAEAAAASPTMLSARPTDLASVSDFAERTEFYSSYKSLANSIAKQAKAAAAMIDAVKEYVDVVDVWVTELNVIPGVVSCDLLLHVDQNSETLIQRPSGNEINQFELFRRYKNSAGQDVYESYVVNDIHYAKMLYIPGVRHEFHTYSLQDGQKTMSRHTVSDHSKGYWEVFDYAPFYPYEGENRWVSFMVATEDICYMFDYRFHTNAVSEIYLTSSDKKTDILRYIPRESSSTVELSLSGFDGVERVETVGKYETGDNVLYTTGGKRYTVGDTLLDGSVTVDDVLVRATTDFEVLEDDTVLEKKVNTGYVSLDLPTKDTDELISLLTAALAEMGLTCRRDQTVVFEKLRLAFAHAPEIASRYLWEGKKVQSIENLSANDDAVYAQFLALEEEIDGYRENPTVRFDENSKPVLAGVELASIESATAQGVSLDGRKVAFEGVSLTLTDTALLDEGKSYRIGLALTPADAAGSDLSHIALPPADGTVYEGGEQMALSVGASEFELPLLEAGEYLLVAYVAMANEDGIRISACAPLQMSEAVAGELQANEVAVTVQRAESGALSVSYRTDANVYAETLEIDGGTTNGQLRDRIADAVFRYGYAGEVLYRKVGNAYEETVATDAAVSGEYRLDYQTEEGDGGSFYLTVTVSTNRKT